MPVPVEKASAVVGQSGGPTAAINATLAGVIKGCLDSEKIDTVYGMRNGIEGLEKGNIFALNPYFEKDERNLDLLSATPAAALGSCRRKIGKKFQGSSAISKTRSITASRRYRCF